MVVSSSLPLAVPNSPGHFVLVGGGWRAAFYMRVVRTLPEWLYLDGMVVRDSAKGAAIESEWGIPTHRTIDAALRVCDPSFVVTCVPWEANPSLVSELAQRRLPVLSETPPAPDVARLHTLFGLVAQGAKIQVAEQYIYQPHHAARLAFVASGRLGTVSQAQVSAAHGYHGASLIRHLLQGDARPVRVRAHAFESPLMAGPDRSGPPTERRVQPSLQTLAWLEIGDKLGVYDFCGDQYFSWIRNERVLVRGEVGEIINLSASTLAQFDTPLCTEIERQMAGANGNLEGLYLKGFTDGQSWLYRNPFAPARLTDDEIAVASVLARMAAYVRDDGPAPYPLAEACEDRYLDILIAQAAESGQPVEGEPQPWHSAVGST